MANHMYTMHPDIENMLTAGRREILKKVEEGTLPNYATFVDRLFKGMATPAEELHHAATGISGESGEILDQTKKVWIYGKPVDLAHIIEEMGDLRFYYQAMLNHFSLTDSDIVAQNMIKLNKRYSDGVYSDKAAIARADKAPVPLSAEGSKGDGKPTERKFMSAAEERRATE